MSPAFVWWPMLWLCLTEIRYQHFITLLVLPLDGVGDGGDLVVIGRVIRWSGWVSINCRS